MGEKFYSHSGRIGILGFGLLPLAGLLPALLLAKIYTLLIYWIPFVYINFVLAGAFGLLMALSLEKTAKLCKVRNTWFVAIFGIISGFTGLYLSWVFHLELAVSDVPALAAVSGKSNPGAVWEGIGILKANGAWSLFGWTPTGWWLLIIWFFEALLVAGFPSFLPAEKVSRLPFCERCDQWTVTRENVRRFSVDSVEAQREALESGDFSAVSRLSPGAGSDSYVRMDLAQCPRCRSCTYMTLVEIVISEGKEKMEENEGQVFIQNLVMTHDQVRQVTGGPERA